MQECESILQREGIYQWLHSIAVIFEHLQLAKKNQHPPSYSPVVLFDKSNIEGKFLWS